MQPFLTVVVPTYNHESSIAMALDSILSQNTNFEFDIWILEDASTDATRSVCQTYVQSHPGKVRLFARDRNLGVMKNLHDGFSRLTAKYFAYLEGDDYWCDESKLQLQVDALEANPDCSMCGHDTLVKDMATGKEWSFVRRMMEPRGRTKFSLKTNPFWTHPSARVYRNMVDLSNVPRSMLEDTAMLYVYQTVGDCYYIDKNMSVYNLTGSGVWTGVNRLTRKMVALKSAHAKNKYCNYRFNAHLGPYSRWRKGLTLMLGKRLGWCVFYHTRMLLYRTQLVFGNSNRPA